jgi:signal transduction histidine kinase
MRSLALIWLLFAYTSSISQRGTPDNLEQTLKSLPDDSGKVEILNQLAFKYLVSQPSLSKEFGEEALNLSRTIHFMKGEIVALNRLGENQFRQSNYANAVEYATQSLKLAEQTHDTVNIAMAYRVLGNTHTFGFKQYDIALQYQLKVLKIYLKKKDKRNIASTYGNITWIYASTNKNLDEALHLANLGAHIADSIRDKQLLSYNYNSKGLIYSQLGELDSALKYLELSIHEGESINDKAVIAYDKSIEGSIYLRQGNNKKAIDLFLVAMEESKRLNSREIIKDCYKGLAQGYSELGNYQLALKNHLHYSNLKDSLLNWETTQKALITRLQFEEEKREAKIAELELANQHVRNENILYNVLFGIVFVFMTVVIVLIVRNSRQRAERNVLLREKNIEIAEQNKKLQEANDLKDKFFSIIGHDLRSPLVSLMGLLGMVMRNEISDKEFKSFAPKLHHLVTGTNETLENLLQWANGQMVGWSLNRSPLPVQHHVSKCINLFAEVAKAKEVGITCHIDEQEIVFADPNQIELIFRNLIHNAIKFSAKGGSVRITAEHRDDFLELRIADDGIGISSDHLENLFKKQTSKTSRGTLGERGTGLGLILCKEMVENNGGRIYATSTEGKGSTFHVLLKSSDQV